VRWTTSCSRRRRVRCSSPKPRDGSVLPQRRSRPSAHPARR
jgi:hypothetical protein